MEGLDFVVRNFIGSLHNDLQFTRINNEGAALTKLLQNPTSNLTTLELNNTDFDVQMFAGMDLSVLPHVIAWVGRYWDNDEATAVYEQLAQAEREEEDEDAHDGEVSIGTCEISLLYHIVKSRAADMSDSL